MSGQSTEQLVRAIEALPVSERLRLLERVLHDLTSLTSEPQRADSIRTRDRSSLLGWLSDEPQLADAITEHSRTIREREQVRVWDDQDAP